MKTTQHNTSPKKVSKAWNRKEMDAELSVGGLRGNFDEWKKEMNDRLLEYEKEETEKKEQRQKEKLKKEAQKQREEERRKNINLNLWGRPKSDSDLEGARTPAKFDHIEETRISNWETKSKTDSVPFVFKKNNEESTEEITTIEAEFLDNNLSMSDQVKVAEANLCAATGTGSTKAGGVILSGTVTAIHRDATGDVTTMIQAAQEALIAMKPADIFEGMLCSRLWALHNQAMYYMGRASNPDAQSQAQEMHTNRAIKFMRLYNETLETLNKHRRKGEQKMVVVHQNVQVNDGGQALVAGELAQGVGGKDKKTKE